jgi:hypothetical protein
MLQNREQRNQLIAGVLIIALGIMALINNAIADDVAAWIWIIGLTVATVGFGWAYTFDKETWTAVGAYLTGAIAILIFLITKVALSGLWVPVIVMLAIALPFLAAWWASREKWGLLIVAYLFFAIIPILLISEGTTNEGELVPAYVTLAIGIPFIIAYFATRNWLLLIPGGIMSFIGLAFVGTSIGLSEQVLTVIVPLLVIVVGVFMLYRTWSGKPQEQKQK